MRLLITVDIHIYKLYQYLWMKSLGENYSIVVELYVLRHSTGVPDSFWNLHYWFWFLFIAEDGSPEFLI